MSKSTRWITSIVLSVPSLCLADLDLEIRPGIGRFGDQNFLDVTKDGDNYRVSAHVEPGGTVLPCFEMDWNADVWSLIHVPTDSLGIIEFAPFGNEGGIFVPSPTVLPPNEQFSQYYLAWGPFVGGVCIPNCPDSDEHLEFSLVEIEPPLPGDFVYNNKVDMDDFLMLARKFGGRRGRAFGSWNDGDANLDDVIDFDDFLILSANFGAERDPPAAVVPEPSTFMLLTLGLFALAARRRRRR